MAQIDHEDTLFPIPQVKALLCRVAVVAVVVSAGVLVKRSHYFSFPGEPWL